MAVGQYRLQIEPPAPYTAPSAATPAQLAAITRPDGSPVLISAGSSGAAIPVLTVEPVRVDIPLDRPGVAVAVSKTASRYAVEPGDAVLYTITVRNPDGGRAKTGVRVMDTPARDLRLRPASVRIDGAAHPEAVAISPDGKGLTITLGTLAAGAVRTVTLPWAVSMTT